MREGDEFVVRIPIDLESRVLFAVEGLPMWFLSGWIHKAGNLSGIPREVLNLLAQVPASAVPQVSDRCRCLLSAPAPETPMPTGCGGTSPCPQWTDTERPQANQRPSP